MFFSGNTPEENLEYISWSNYGIKAILSQERLSMATIYKKLGEKVRKVRKKQGLTQEKLAELARIDPKSIIEIEGGKRNPTLKTIRKIATALKVKPFNLLP